MYVGEPAWVSITARSPPDRPAYRRWSSGATASPFGAAPTSIEPANRGWGEEMSMACTLSFVRSARYRRWAVWSASTPSKDPAATAGTASWRTVDWQLAQPLSRMTPPAAARIGTTAERNRAARGPRRFTYPKTCCRREVRAPCQGRFALLVRRAPGGHQLAQQLRGESAHEQRYELRYAGVREALDGLVGGQVDRLLGHPAPVFGLDRADLRFDLPEHGRVESSFHAFLLTTTLTGTPQARAGPTASSIIGRRRAGFRGHVWKPSPAFDAGSQGPNPRARARNRTTSRRSGSRAARPRPGPRPRPG